MAGVHSISVQELNKMKFHVIQRFGFLNANTFFIGDTIPPVRFGADCRDYTVYEVHCDNASDFAQLADFFEKLFGKRIDKASNRNIRKSVDDLMKQFQKEVKEVDWGACHVRYIPFSEQYRISC